MSFEREMSDELARVGIRGGLRRRILAEYADHLSSDPNAQLGPPGELATQFADELGTRRARRAGMLVFVALVLAGGLFAVALGSSRHAGTSWPRLHANSVLLRNLGGWLALLGAQVAFVAGLLAGLRAFRYRDVLVIPRAEAIVIVRRAVVGVGAGLAAMAGVALIAAEVHAAVWWHVLALACAGVGALALLTVTPALVGALELRPAAGGEAGDLFDDIGPVTPSVLRGHPWRFAVVVAAALAIVLTLAGVIQSDGYDGAFRGIIEALGCLGGFALLGPYLGLRTAPAAD